MNQTNNINNKPWWNLSIVFLFKPGIIKVTVVIVRTGVVVSVGVALVGVGRTVGGGWLGEGASVDLIGILR